MNAVLKDITQDYLDADLSLSVWPSRTNSRPPSP
jgi:hypothetical protein